MVIIIPRVMMKGFIFSFAIMSPFTMPTARAATRARTIAGAVGMPATRASPQTTPVNARVDPTERSRPPETRRITIPTAIVPSTDKPRRIASMLGHVRKTGEAMVMAMPATMRTRIRIDSRNASTDLAASLRLRDLDSIVKIMAVPALLSAGFHTGGIGEDQLLGEIRRGTSPTILP